MKTSLLNFISIRNGSNSQLNFIDFQLDHITLLCRTPFDKCFTARSTIHSIMLSPMYAECNFFVFLHAASLQLQYHISTHNIQVFNKWHSLNMFWVKLTYCPKLYCFFFSFGSHKDERDMTSTGHISSSEAYKEKNSKPSTRNLGQQLSFLKKNLVEFGICG